MARGSTAPSPPLLLSQQHRLAERPRPVQQPLGRWKSNSLWSQACRHRLTPDLALNADDGHDATLFCSEGVCEYTTAANGQNTLADAGLVGGTSVAAPSMAGIQALINNYNAVNNPEPGNPTGRQGIPDYVYYGLAAAQNDCHVRRFRFGSAERR